MKTILNALYQKEVLNYERSRDVLIHIARGDYNPAQIASFMTVYMMRGVTVQELAGFRDALMELCVPVDFDGIQTIDLCGTGGDGKDTFNISTLASFVVAGAGYEVAKHGNYGVSSISGSSNVLEHLGYRFKNDAASLRRELERTGICFMHAPLFHPAMKTVAPIRKELGVKTFFNMLGPLVNPSRPAYQMNGVFSLGLARMYHYLLQQTNTRYAIVHNLDGYDECSLTAPARIMHSDGESQLSPQDFGYEVVDPNEIAGGHSIASSAALFINILKGQATKAQQHVVAANAAIALQCRTQKPLEECVQMAEESLFSGMAYQKFQQLIQMQ